MRAFVVVFPLAVIMCGCMGDPACTKDGSNALMIPVTRLASVSAVSAAGACRVGPLPTSCSAAPRCIDALGQQSAEVVVSPTARGTCTVTVAFSDGCAPETHVYEVGGPYENCCEANCIQPTPWMIVGGSCGK